MIVNRINKDRNFNNCKVVPLVLTSKIVCALWFSETADSVFSASGRTKKAPGARLSEGIADLLFSLIIYFCFMVQASLAKSIPIEEMVRLSNISLFQTFLPIVILL